MSISASLDPKTEGGVLIEEDDRNDLRAEAKKSGSVHELDPLRDARWQAFVDSHLESSIFHTRGWLEALQKTYGYQPVVYTTTDRGPLTNGVLFCRVASWLTGERLVSLPFSDHCQPLASGQDLNAICRHLHEQRKQKRMRYVEIRPLAWDSEGRWREGFFESGITSFQKIDLRPELNALYKQFHDSCVRRKIKRAEREGLVYQSGRSDVLLEAFRKLLLLTRRRHKLPPQPAAWFRNLAKCLGDQMEIHVVYKGEVPAASILTLRHKNQVTYKYGCSDAELNNMGGTPLLFWKVIQQAKASGADEFDLGRSDYSDPGLIAFKEHLGATTTNLCYYRNPEIAAKPEKSRGDDGDSWARNAFARMPDFVLQATGEILYRHLG